MADVPPLPPGFTLDSASDVPPLPPGFALDSKQPSQDDPFAGDPSLSNEAIANLDAGLPSPQSPQPSAMREVKDYFGGINDATARFNRAPARGPLGTMEALATLATGGIAAPVLGTIESIALGTNPEESHARYTYQPRTESGKAQLGMLGAVMAPITESGADVALGPLLAAESRAVPSPATIRAYARSARAGRSSVPGQPVAVDTPLVGAEANAVSGAKAQRSAGLEKVPVPSREELAAAAQAAYKRADDAGLLVKESSVKGLKSRIVSMAKKEGIDKDLHPDSSAALKKILGESGDKTLSEIETLRKVAKDAQGSLKPADKRLAGKIVDELDDYIDSLSDGDVVKGDVTKVQALKEARGLYARAKKAELIDDLTKRAELSAPNFSGSGMENAIRTEFRSLAKNRKLMRMFTAEEQAAIRKVAQGGKVENALRFLGKFAPTGVVSTGLGSGAGFVAGGPVGAVALPAAGLASRYAATRMTMRNVRKADELMRRGPQNALVEPAKKPQRNAMLEY